ncbi:MAG: hexitol phosphatase HxpB [Bacteroidota bacterium]
MIALEDIDAVIYDMDGVLINSEPFWKATEIKVFEQVGIDFVKVGGEKTVGLRIDEVIDYWYARYPWTNMSTGEVLQSIMKEMEHRVRTEGAALSGVEESIAFFKARGMKIGLASSSFYTLIDAVLDRLEIREHFAVINSAEDLKHGKPHPAIYIKTAEELGVDPTRCLVIEDSLNGIISAKAAKMQVVAIPDGTHSPDKRIILADQIEESLSHLVRSFESKSFKR